MYSCRIMLLWSLGPYGSDWVHCSLITSVSHAEETSPSQTSWAGVPDWLFSPPYNYLWRPHPCCLLGCLEDPDSRTPVLSSRILHWGNLTSQPTSGSHCVSFIRHSHNTIVNLKLNYTPILLSPACPIYPKSSDFGGGAGVGRGLFFPSSPGQVMVFRDKVDRVWGRDSGPSMAKAQTLFLEEIMPTAPLGGWENPEGLREQGGKRNLGRFEDHPSPSDGEALSGW